jgi:hypothetical protein
MAPPTLVRGTAYSMQVSGAFSGSAYTEYYKVYIDYNKNGVFTDAGELVASTSSSAATTLTLTSFTIPSTATTGTTRMRVVMSDASATTSCGTFSYGETEDYTVNISATKEATANEIVINGGVSQSEKAIEHITLYPNPAQDYFNISINAAEVKGTVSIFNVSGQEVMKREFNSNNSQIDISSLSSGIYTVKIDDGAKGATFQFMKK